MDMALSDPGKPWQNGADESFNGKFRDECLSLEWFSSRPQAKVMIELVALAVMLLAAGVKHHAARTGRAHTCDGAAPGRAG
jgi:hypothetical protein